MLNPIPYGFFVGTLIFDLLYAFTAEMLWAKSAVWLVSLGVVADVIPRLIDLGHVWLAGRHPVAAAERTASGLNLLALAAAVCNAFVHGRDAYEQVPVAALLSLLTVLLGVVAQMVLASNKLRVQGDRP